MPYLFSIGRLEVSVVFIIGASRTGTSVLSDALGRSPEIVATEELHYYNLLRQAAEAAGEGDGWLLSRLRAIQTQGKFFEIKNGTATDLPSGAPLEGDPRKTPLRVFFDELAQEANARVVVEQTPMNLFYKDEILRDFPDALFILMVRDPRAIIASQKMRWRIGLHGARDIPERDIKRVRYSGHPLLQLLLLRNSLRVGRLMRTDPNVIVVAYEDLVSRPRDVLADLTTRLGVPFIPELTHVSSRGSSHTREVDRVGFDPARIEHWKENLSQTELWLTERLYGKDLVMPKTNARPKLTELVLLVLTFPYSLVMAAVYSWSGYGHVLDAIRRRFL